ncbi:hypothetical protein C2134_15955 [Chromobacterium sinusclupearum]|uniref:4Fe-4S ferredoxin-type domain-containing protein n=1 Tax=Chromobacterium sinusclupearum TaxID=2077146 RepID=A0A2K4MJR5_9NEIS|nr:hypothetical protein [Chromobacterium sinusclupearum]POA97334.1 hypothetical protein C2134_15955 [Chromobacterium sinusclupearum]
MASRQVVWLRIDAPAKPAAGQPCNGCGVCCAAAPCPLSRLLLKHRAGPCPALEWDAPRYRCGLLQTPRRYLPRLPAWAEPGFRRLARRYLAIGHGCDSLATTEEDP